MSSDRDATLGDYFTLQRGNTYKSRLLGEPGPVLLGLASIHRNGGFRDDNLRTYGGPSDERVLVERGDLYVSLKDVTQAADLLGAVARFPKGYGRGRLTQDTVKLVPRGSGVPLDYLYWVMRTPHYRRYCRSRATGTTNLGLPRDDFLGYAVPALNDARERIVRLLESLEGKIGLNQRIVRALRVLRTALFEESIVARKANDWPLVRLSEVAGVNVRSLKTLPDEISYVDISTVSPGRINDPTKYIRDEAPGRARRLVQHGDTIWSMVRPNRRSHALVMHPPADLVVSTGFAVLTPREVPYSYLYEAVTTDSFVDYLMSKATGSAYPAVGAKTFEEARLRLPPASVMERYHSTVGPMWEQEHRRVAENATLGALRDTVLPKLISGELRVGDAERMSEDVA